MPRLIHQNPKYRRHRASGQAVVTLCGQDIYLGPYGTQASRNAYDRAVGEWQAAGRRLQPAGGLADIELTELIAAYWKFAEGYYTGESGRGELASIKLALKVFKRLYGSTRAVTFGPLAMKAVREAMIGEKWCRGYINSQVGRLKRLFRWGVEQEMISAINLQALKTVPGLRRGKCEAHESDPVRPVPEEHVAAVLPFVSTPIRSMIKLQLLTGMRPGEVVIMRGQDIDTTGTLWEYRPAVHKTAHHGHTRIVPLGPKAQAILKPILKSDLAAPLFSPADAEAARREAMHAARETPLSCGNRPGTNRKRRPKRSPGDRYDVATYRRAIARACVRAEVPEWHPHQLRHTAATQLRKEFGLEAAQVILGHRTLSVTEIYAEKNVAAAREIMQKVG